MLIRPVLGLLVACTLQLSAHAQFRILDPDESWTETEAPPPPTYSINKLVKVEGPVSSSLRFGVDPDTISIGPDQVVRYVIVMQGPTATTAVYEGIRCTTGEKRVYARRNDGDSSWRITKESWQPLKQSSATQYAWNMARDGVCMGAATNKSVREIVNDLRSDNTRSYL